MTKPCTGCVHLFVRHGRGYCQEHWLPAELASDPYTGAVKREARSKTGQPFPLLAADARAPGGRCGPGAVLYEPAPPPWFVRLWRWARGVSARH